MYGQRWGTFIFFPTSRIVILVFFNSLKVFDEHFHPDVERVKHWDRELPSKRHQSPHSDNNF